MNSRHFISIAIIIFGLWFQDSVAQQLTRKQLGQKFFQATQYHNIGKDSLAIATLEEVAELLPNFALTYRREAEIYDDMSQQGNQLALNGAVLMYRKYLTLELDANKTADAEHRLRVLEDQLNIEHFEDKQRKQAQEEVKRNVILASMDDNETDFDEFVMSVSRKTKTSISRNSTIKIPKKTALVENKESIDSKETSTDSNNVKTSAEVQIDIATGNKQTIENVNDKEPISNLSIRKDRKKTLSYIDYFNLSIPNKATVNPSNIELAINNENLIGHWVSSETNPSGREYWIFDITPFSSTLNVTLSDNAGVVCPDDIDKDLSEKVMDLLKNQNILGHTTQMEISDRMANSSAINNNHFVFTIEGSKEYVPNTNIYTWTKQILDNITPVIPFGNLIAKVGETVTTNLTKKDEAATYKIVMRFDCTMEDEGVLQCVMQKRTTRTTSSGAKTNTEMQNFALYRTSNTYSHFVPELLSSDEEEVSIMNKVKEQVEINNKYAYGLGLLYYYGIGEEKNIQEAVSFMTLASQTEMAPKAMVWLAKFYNEEAMNANSLSFWNRRKYHKMSDLWLNKMKQLKLTEWYGAKGDILSLDEDKEKQDSASIYYHQGAIAGDPYCCYKYALQQNAKGNFKEGADKLLMAGQKGFADAYCELAIMHRLGQTGTTSYNDYLKYLELALENGSIGSLKELANAYLMGYGIPKDFVKGNVIRCYWYQSIQHQWKNDLYLLGLNIDEIK